MSTVPRTADQLRAAFCDFYAARDHLVIPSASLIPHDPTVLFNVAGMVPFKPYFVGDETPPGPRAVTSQKCARAGGKHNDLDDVGRTTRHLVFFEMLGNFSFGDYFKSKAIPWAWELVTEVFGMDGDRLWITVHTSDDEAEAIWHEQVGVPLARIQRLGDKDNFWQMGDVGPCGPCSEIHIDRGDQFGPDGGPLGDPAGERFMEFYNLVFMQFNQAADGSRTPLPKPSIDTGAGLERILCLLQGVPSVWETDLMAPLIEQARAISGATYRPGDYDDRPSFSLRVLAEHARSSAMLVGDGVFPSNEGRGYVLRRIIRRAVRHAYMLGTERLVMPALVDTAITIMGNAYPDVARQRDYIVDVISREEERFRHTLKTGLTMLEGELTGTATLSGSSAFSLHDTYGFPLELTEEIAAERGIPVDRDGFDAEMAAQRARAKAARKGTTTDQGRAEAYRDLAEEYGPTRFVGYTDDSADARVLAVLDAPDGLHEVFLDVTPFYAESGGQVGDTGVLRADGVQWDVLDTTFAVPGVRRHLCRAVTGTLDEGDIVVAAIDGPRRTAIRRNHTATHLLHHALRAVLGDHVKQAGSLVAADRLRFDFSHYAALTEAQLEEIERQVNETTLANHPATVVETSKDEALARGAIAFFGDKYGDQVRMLEVGPSVELCGGTHVAAAGDIGLVKIVAESSIGSNLRRVEAVTGMNAWELMRREERRLTEAAHLVGGSADDVVENIERRLAELKAAQDELRAARAKLAAGRAAELAGAASGGVVVARVDGLAPGALRDLAIAVRQQPGVDTVVLVGESDSNGVSLVGAVTPGSGRNAGELIRDAARAVGGGGGGKGDIATAGGKNAAGIDEALRIASAAAGAAAR